MKVSDKINTNTIKEDLIPCTPHSLDSEFIDTFKGQILSSEKAQKMAEFFSLLGDPNRLRILSVLAKQELCVCDLAATLDMTESAVSHQLRTLKAMRLVSYQKRGRKVFYRLLDHHVLELYSSVAEHLDETD
ncbi:metalloregulator ArsR/SmtB family transcription factor [Cyanobacterium aponinum UTEX 3222]|uniref:Transcriptional regulator, ArsR family n=3 Tax=Cyanobacterium aponinum TaxID=379064 RepID=K9Z354_CYAAP|nr:metalloregulator ArsR/SmtB family transcription factor [Cyanobacterium aponinum]WRL40717.1 metalloregulator ArsR/SmtB family transcription factor [Cyanobacterium aponinum UTEX 3222]AFZ52788.1 transcriptional regulator, ArsR family [Cyanobacterium aponinum PCC 10605]MTF37904.1 metalloregulator ArsR/SmtB family transcription factor [Cyanobacterium aponinum 0216]PHV62292.1 ArsR family transcriptional regulator [Cyanobacterium aponinum IPPAS B-1201]WPF87059.1 metalloregulator ArsR/SmtB family t